MTKNTSQPPVRITNQFWKGHAMVYDLACDEIRLTIEVSARENRDGHGEWTVEAHARKPTEKIAIAHPGPTRDDALRAVARSWAEKRGMDGFPSLDWEAVTKALLAVRAI